MSLVFMLREKVKKIGFINLRFLTDIDHPRVDDQGRVNLDILEGSKWLPVTMMRTVLLSVQALLTAPNPDDLLKEISLQNEALLIKFGK